MKAQMKITKLIATIFGILLILAGGTFALQGMNVITTRSVMRGNPDWIVYGGAMVIVGVIVVAAANWQRIRTKK